MKNFLIAISLMLAPYFLGAQIADRTETSCFNLERSIYQVGMEGKPLIVASKGLDCSICMNHAPAVGTFANTYAGQIEVWGAMNFRYNSQPPGCPAVATWNNSYSWTQVFTFIDADDYWVGIGFPTYHVIHPSTHEVVYAGGNWNTASNAALGLLSLSANEVSTGIASAKVYADGDHIYITLPADLSGPVVAEVFNLTGQRMAAFAAQADGNAFPVKVPFAAHQGIYILSLSQNGSRGALKFAVMR